MDKPSFEQLIREDRAARESKRWRGPFLEYLELVRQNPLLTKLSHGRLYEMMMRDGTQDILESEDPRVKRLFKDEPLKVYNFFRDEFFGIEKTVGQIVRYFHSAVAEGRGEPPGALPDGAGRLRQELAGREAAARPRAVRTRLRHRRLPDVRGAAAPHPAPSAQGVREDARRRTSRATSARCAASA